MDGQLGQLGQLDLFATDDTPTLPLARPSAANPNAYAHTDCCRISTEPMPGHRLELGFARAADGWHMSAGYLFPAVGSIGPIFIRSNAYPCYADARQAGLRRLQLMMNGLYMSRTLTPDKLAHLRRAIDNFPQAAPCGLSLLKEMA